MSMYKKEYTEKIHAKRLLKMLEKKNPCMCCPAAKGYNGNNYPNVMWENTACIICR